MLLGVTDRNQSPVRQQFCNAITALEIVQSQIALLAIEKKHFFEGHNKVLPLLVQDMAGLVQLIRILDAT